MTDAPPPQAQVLTSGYYGWDEQAARDLLAAADLPAGSLQRLVGGTNAVWKLNGTPWVLRVAGPDVSEATLSWQLAAAGALSGAGVRFASPARLAPLVLDGPAGTVRATLWTAVKQSGEPGYGHFGAAVRTLHDLGRAALDGAGVALSSALDVAHLGAKLASGSRAGWAGPAEVALLGPWVERVQAGLEPFRHLDVAVVHDDLWIKNACGPAAVLCDPDNLGSGPAVYDLAFVTRGLESGSVSTAQAAAFVRGYGADLPALDDAWALALAHRLRWVVLLMERRSWHPSASATLAVELPLWARPRGPRP